MDIEERIKRYTDKCKLVGEVPMNIFLYDDKYMIGPGNDRCINVKIPDYIEQIAVEAFAYNRHIVKLEIPDNVEKIGGLAFENCRNLEYVKISEKVKVLDAHTFKGCSKLKEVILPSKLKVIEQGAFEGCPRIERLVIPESVDVIESNVFYFNSIIKLYVSRNFKCNARYLGLNSDFQINRY